MSVIIVKLYIQTCIFCYLLLSIREVELLFLCRQDRKARIVNLWKLFRTPPDLIKSTTVFHSTLQDSSWLATWTWNSLAWISSPVEAWLQHRCPLHLVRVTGHFPCQLAFLSPAKGHHSKQVPQPLVCRSRSQVLKWLAITLKWSLSSQFKITESKNMWWRPSEIE